MHTQDLLKREVLHKVLEQVYMQGKHHDTYALHFTLVRDVGRALELFYINISSGLSSGNVSDAGVPMDIGAATVSLRQQQSSSMGKVPQCYNCQQVSYTQQKAQVTKPKTDPDPQKSTLQEMDFDQMWAYFTNLEV
ncbi:hypothetical protein V8B97DRAFT_2011031 [Scleroderma yunnanense]